MATEVNPGRLCLYKIVKENEQNGKTLFSFKELLAFSERALKEARKIDGQEYWILIEGEYGQEFKEFFSRICDVTTNYVELSPQKYNEEGKTWARKRIGGMKYSHLKGAVVTLREDLQEEPKVSAEKTLAN